MKVAIIVEDQVDAAHRPTPKKLAPAMRRDWRALRTWRSGGPEASAHPR
jgi:hypothetical protein